MTFTAGDRRLLARLAGLLRGLDPVPPSVLANAFAAGLRIAVREPRLPSRGLDLAWLLELR